MANRRDRSHDRRQSNSDDSANESEHEDDETPENDDPVLAGKEPMETVSYGKGFDWFVNISPQPPSLRRMKGSSDHILMIESFTYDRNDKFVEPKPANSFYKDDWGSDYVRMPCSKRNINKDGISKWPGICSELKYLKNLCEANIATMDDLKRTIEQCSRRKFDLSSLEKAIREYRNPKGNDDFISTVLPKMCDLAMEIDKICSRALPLLRIRENKSVTMSQKQAASILACQFFCLFPKRCDSHESFKFKNFPHRISFYELYQTGEDKKVEKLKCILNYFTRITSRKPVGVITFQRRQLKDIENPKWNKSKEPLCEMHMTSEKRIEDIYNVLQVDFANKYIGGGVLGNGCVQEEIRFAICPEMLISLLLCEKMEENECIFLIGCEQFSAYTGYSDSFKFDRDYIDPTLKDTWGRKWCHLVAMDAIFYRNRNDQYSIQNVQRELTKAYASFQPLKDDNEYKFPIATGNWGCGAFNGDKSLKAIVQIMAASEAGRPLIYAAYRDRQFIDSLKEIYDNLESQKATVRDLYKYISKYVEQRDRRQSFFDFIKNTPLSVL